MGRLKAAPTYRVPTPESRLPSPESRIPIRRPPDAPRPRHRPAGAALLLRLAGRLRGDDDLRADVGVLLLQHADVVRPPGKPGRRRARACRPIAPAARRADRRAR